VALNEKWREISGFDRRQLDRRWLKMRFKLNPIVKKDLKVTSRSMRLSWGLFAYETVLVLAFLLALLSMQEGAAYDYRRNIYNYFIYLFPVLAVTQTCIVALIVPILTASSISGEKERQTFDIMMTTCMSPFAIVLGKMVSAVLRILFFVAASLPVMALAFVVGGLSWSTLFYFLMAIVMLSVFSGSIGILCSAFCKRSISAVILSFVIYFVIFVLSFVPLLLRLILEADSGGEALLPLLFNPVVFFEEFFMQVMSGSSLLGGDGSGPFTRDQVGFLTWHLTQGRVWMYVSVVCILLLSLFFMLLAAWRVNPLHGSSGRRRRKKGAE